MQTNCFTFGEYRCILKETNTKLLFEIMNQLLNNKIWQSYRYDFCDVKLSKNSPYFQPINPSGTLKIALICEGETKVIVEGKTKLLKQDEIAIICPKTLYMIERAEAELCEISIDLSRAGYNTSRFIPFFNVTAGVPAFVTKDDKYYDEIYQAAQGFATVKSKDECETAIYNLLQTIFNNRINNRQSNVTDAKQLYAVTKILQLICETTEITIENVALMCGYSEFYIMKLFKQYTGETIVDYSNKYKIYIAAKLLKEGRESVRDIAKKVGFDNISYFNRQFKRLYQVTPKEYRQQHNSKQ